MSPRDSDSLMLLRDSDSLMSLRDSDSRMLPSAAGERDITEGRLMISDRSPELILLIIRSQLICVI